MFQIKVKYFNEMSILYKFCLCYHLHTGSLALCPLVILSEPAGAFS